MCVCVRFVQSQVIYPPTIPPPPTETCVILPTTQEPHHDQITVPLGEEEKLKPSFSHKLKPAEGDKSMRQMGFYHSAGMADKLFVEHDTSKQQLKNEQPFSGYG